MTATSRFERERAHKAAAGLRGLGEDARADEIAALIHAESESAHAMLLAKTARAEAEVEMRGSRKAAWDTAYINQLPDSAFLYVAPGGTKDSDGKTVPRSLRSFPYKDASGKVDLPHLRNALARIPQSNLPPAVKDRCTQTAQRILDQQNKAVSTADTSKDSTDSTDYSNMSDEKLLAMIKMLDASGENPDASAACRAEAKRRGLKVPPDPDEPDSDTN